VRRPYARQAAAAGIDFAAAVAAIGAIERWKHLNTPGEIAVHASKHVFATVTLLYGIAGIFLFWFVSTMAARMRQLEGGSGRLAAAVNGSGAVIAGFLALGAGMMWASHQLQSPESAAMATSLLDGPTIFFPAAVLVGASGVIGYRAKGLPAFSRIVAIVSVPLAVAFVGASGLILFKNYAWINDTGNIVFAAWILVLSAIGIARWTDLDDAGAPPAEPMREPARARAAPPPPPAPAEAPEPRARRKPRPPRKFAPRHTDLAREYQRRLHEAESEAPAEKEEFEYGGPPPRMTEPVEVTPARRQPRPKPAPRPAPGSKPQPRKAAPRRPARSASAAPDTGDDEPARKPVRRKPRPRRAPAPAPAEPETGDGTEDITRFDEKE
jgi:hypothetical protein